MFSKNRDFIKINDAILKLLNGILINLRVEGFLLNQWIKSKFYLTH